MADPCGSSFQRFSFELKKASRTITCTEEGPFELEDVSTNLDRIQTVLEKGRQLDCLHTKREEVGSIDEMKVTKLTQRGQTLLQIKAGKQVIGQVTILQFGEDAFDHELRHHAALERRLDQA